MNDEFKHYKKGLENISKHLGSNTSGAYAGVNRDVIFTKDKVQLFRYCKPGSSASSNAVLIVYALVNRPYILDIKPDRSFIKGLIEQGLTVYLVDWGYPDEAESKHNLESYILGYIDDCVDAVREDLQQKKVHLLGVCQGGTLSLCYTALQQQKVHSLTLMVTPVDFQAGDNLLAKCVKYVDIDELVHVLGNVPGPYLDIALQSLKPLSNSMNKYLKFVSSMSEDATAADILENFSLMEQWLLDRPDQPGEFMREFVKSFYQSNSLIKGDFFIGSRQVDLQKVVVPIHNIYATRDHIVPKESSQALASAVASKVYLETEISTGHIGIFVSASALKKAPKAVANWIQEQSLGMD